MHGWGVTEALAGLPDWVGLLFALLTQLADAWFVFGGLSLLYLLGDERLASRPRRSGAILVALGIAALAVTVTLKTLFGVHRPAGAGTVTTLPWLPGLLDAVYANIATGDGFGFPSGHATTSTIVYGGLALYLDRLWTRRRRLVGAAGVVGVVSLSRLVIGVHHLPDVLAGVVAGTAVLLGVRLMAGDDARVSFLAATALGALAILAASIVAPDHPDEALKAAIAAGAAAGGAVAWDTTGGDQPAVSVPTAVVGAAVLGGAWGGIYVAELPLPASALGSALVVGLIVALPALATRRRGEDAPAADSIE